MWVSGYICSPVCSCSQAKMIQALLYGLSSCERGLQFMPISICDV